MLISDRIFEILGINYRLNQWYIEKITEKLGGKFNSNLIKPLTIIDIDTLIYWTSHLKNKDTNLRRLIDNHIKQMTKRIKVNHPDFEKGRIIANKKLTNQIAPISSRFPEYKFPMKLLVDKFRDVLPEKIDQQ